MNVELHTFSELSGAEQEHFASIISAQTHTEQKIVPVDSNDILQRGIGLVALEENVLRGYVGVKDLDDVYTQIGTLVVVEQAQRSGVGSLLVASITKLVDEAGRQPFAFCNPSSQPSFEKAGYVPAMPGELPPEAVSQFGNLPMIHPWKAKEAESALVGAGVLAE